MVVSIRSRHKVYHREDCIYGKRIDTKYKRFISEENAKNLGYEECSWCGGLHRAYLNLKENPNYYVKTKKPMKFYWDSKFKGLCVETNVGFWKILKSWNTNKFALYHLNRTVFESKKTVKERMDGRHHRQMDVEQTDSIQMILHYISEHDKAKQIMKEHDYRALPQKTKQQRKYYNKAKKKARREENRRIDRLFEQIQNGRSKRK